MTDIPLKLETSMLAFARSLQISEALMWGVAGDSKAERLVPIAVVDKGVRGQTSNDFEKEKDRLTSAGHSNPQVVEAAYVPPGCHALEISFSMRVMPGSISPHACDDVEVTRSYEALARLYAGHGGYRSLAERYIWNLLNGRFAWRNAFQTDVASVRLSWDCASDRELQAVVLDAIGRQEPMPLAEIARLDGLSDTLDAEAIAARLDDLAECFAKALSGQSGPLTIEVRWRGEMLPAQEVFPSQEYLRAEKTSEKVSRVYAKIMSGGVAQASIHSQKIGAALRHIDTWHGSADYGAVAVNPYTGIQETGEVLRDGRDKAKALHFYAIRSKPKELVAGIGSAIPDNLHFIMANLVRGGVFGTPKKTKAKVADADLTDGTEELAQA